MTAAEKKSSRFRMLLKGAINAQQKAGIGKIVEERKDVFVNLPTGSENLGLQHQKKHT